MTLRGCKALNRGPVFQLVLVQSVAELPGGTRIEELVLTWDARRLPGPWIMFEALDAACERAQRFGIGAVSVRRSHHIAALAPYARRVAERGMVLLLMTSAPSGGSVAPYGGTAPLFSPSPIGVGFPTGAEPVLVDVSTSITTNGMTNLLAREGRRLPGPWLMDETGQATDGLALMLRHVGKLHHIRGSFRSGVA